MTDALDIPALELRLEHHAKGARRIPAEPLFSLPADEVRALIAAAKERDLFADEMSKRGLALDDALAEIVSLRAILAQADGKWDARIAPCPTCGFHFETVQHAPTFIIEE